MTVVRKLPAREKPVRRLRDAGPVSLSTTELLACLLQTPNALEQSQELLAEYGSLRNLGNASEEELTAMHGIGPAAAARIRAAVEFGRRVVLEGYDEKAAIHSPADVANLLMAEMGHLEQEHFVVILLDARNRIIHQFTLYVGTTAQSNIRIGEVFRAAVRQNACAMIVAHNHPSGDPTPSPEDVEVTRQILAAGDLMDVELLDHLVIGHHRFISLRERGLGFS